MWLMAQKQQPPLLGGPLTWPLPVGLSRKLGEAALGRGQPLWAQALE